MAVAGQALSKRDKAGLAALTSTGPWPRYVLFRGREYKHGCGPWCEIFLEEVSWLEIGNVGKCFLGTRS
jgi:hypothetical protein